MKFGLLRVFIWVNIQKKFQVPQSHSIREICDANFDNCATFNFVSYHRIFLVNCTFREHEIWFAKSIHMG